MREIYEKSLKVVRRGACRRRNERRAESGDGGRTGTCGGAEGARGAAANHRGRPQEGVAQFVPAIKADLEAMLHEIQRGRTAIEFEKKTHASNLEHRWAMDNNMIIMSSEVEKLRAELANAKKRARAAIVLRMNGKICRRQSRVIKRRLNVGGYTAVVETVLSDSLVSFVRGGASQLLAVGMCFPVRWKRG